MVEKIRPKDLGSLTMRRALVAVGWEVEVDLVWVGQPTAGTH
jgi:hypothetical protein